MGQGCSGNLSDVLSDPANNSSDSLNGPHSHSSHSRADTLWRHSHSRRIHELLGSFSPDDIQRLLLLYRSKCYAERNRLLVGSQTNSNSKASSQPLIQSAWRRVTLSDSVLFSLFPSLHVSYIYSLLEGVSRHRSNLPRTDPDHGNEERGNEVDWTLLMNQLRVVDKKHLIRAFHGASYLYNPMDAVDIPAKGNSADLSHHPSPNLSPGTSFRVSQSVLNLNINSANPVTNNKNVVNAMVFTPSELLLQDFLFALSLCKTGTYQEQLAMLFVLFAEPIVDNNNDNSNNNTNRRSISTGIVNNNMAVNGAGSLASGGAVTTSEPRSPDHVSVEMTPLPVTNEKEAVNSNSTILNPPASPATAVAAPPLVSNKSRMSLTGSSKVTTGEKTQLQKLELSELGALRMWVFMQLQLLRVMNPILSNVCSNNTNSVQYSNMDGINVKSVDWSDCCGMVNSVFTTLLYYAEKLATLQASTSVNSSTTLSYAEFMNLAYTAHNTHTLPDYCHLSTNMKGDTGNVNIFDTLQESNILSAFNVRSVLHELACDVLPSYTQVLRLSVHHLNPTTSRRHKDLHMCLSLLHIQQEIPKDVQCVHEVFAMDARWFLAWCKLHKLTPVFYHNNTDATTSITSTLNTSIVYNSSNLTANLPVPSPKAASSPKKKHRGHKYKPPFKDNSAEIKHLVVGLAPMVDAQSDISSELSSSGAERSHLSLPALHNASLLYKDALGAYRLKPTGQLLPYTPVTTTTTTTNKDDATSGVDSYVILPYVVGKAMYEYFDPQSQYIAASAYKRVLRIASNARPVPTTDANHVNRVDRDVLQSIAPTATQLVKNFQSVNTVYITPHPSLVPIYVCSAYGTASVAPIDTLLLTVLPPVCEHAASVCSVHSTYNMVGANSSGMPGTASTDLTTLLDFIVHTSSVLVGTNFDSTEPQDVCRVWGLYTESAHILGSDICHVPTLQHTTTTVWRLLTIDPADYAIPLSTLFGDTLSSNARNKSRTFVEQRKCLGLMVEYSTTPYILHNATKTTLYNTATSPVAEPAITTISDSNNTVCSVWPTDRILHAQGHTRFLSQDTTSAENKECPFSIAEHVDVLNNNNQWCVGIVTNIARDHVPTHNNPHNINVSVTVRPLVDSDGRPVATKVPKLSGPGIKHTAISDNVPSDPVLTEPLTVNNIDTMPDTKPSSKPQKTESGDDSDDGEGEDDEEGEEEGSEEGSVESAIVNNVKVTPTPATATASAPPNNIASSGNGGEQSEEEDGSEEGSSSEDESADDNSLIRDKRSRSATTAKPANTANPTKSTTNNDTADGDTARAGVTWPTATGSCVVIVAYNSLRILDLGTMTIPTINTNNNELVSATEAYLPKMLHNLHTTYRQHLAHKTTLNASAVDKLVVVNSPAGSNVSRQPSAVPSNINSGNATPIKNAMNGNNIITPPKQDSNSALTGPKNSLFNSPGKNSVVPHTPEVYTNTAETAQGDDVLSVDVLQKGKLASGELTAGEWAKLQKCMCNVNTCPFPQRALYILLLTERINLLPPKHPHKCTVCISSGLYDANRYLYIAPLVAPEMIGVMNSADDNHSTTSYSSSNAPHHKNHQRDPISKFFKGCGKSIQRSFAPKETDIVGQTDLLNHLNNGTTTATTITSNNANGTSQSRGEMNNTTVPDEHRKTFKDGQIGPMNVRGNSSSTINTQPNNNNNANFPNQKPTTVGATIAKPQVVTSVNNIGIRIVGVAGLNNLGNTCFMSASLQCLFRTTTLVNYFLTMQYKLDINTRSNLGSKGKLTEEFAKFVHGIFTLQPTSLTAIQLYVASTVNTTAIPRSLQYTSYSPTTLLKAFQAHKPQFSGADQQDSQEFLCELLDTFHEDLKLPRAVVVNGKSSAPGASASVTEGAPSKVDVSGDNSAPPAHPVVEAAGTSEVQVTSSVTDPINTNHVGTVSPVITHRERSHSTISQEKRNSRSNTHTLLPLTETERTLSVQEQGNHTWAHYMQNNASIVTNLFQGQMCSKIVCNVCHTSSANFEPFTTLSMPIPRTNAVSIAHNELTTVFVTVYRKMPRLNRILHLPPEVFDHGQLTEAQLVGLYQSTRNPIKLALSFPRNTSIEQVLLKAVNVYNQFELQCMQESHSSDCYGLNGEVSGQHENTQTVNISANEPSQNVRQQSSVSQQSPTNNGTSPGGAEVNTNASGAEHNAPVEHTPRSENDHNSAATSTNNNHYSNKGISSIYAVQPLVLTNTIVIDVNDKQKGRYGKMLDKKDILQTLLDESTNECHLVLQERVKDISFVAGLAASRLNAEYVRHQRPQQLAFRNSTHNNHNNHDKETSPLQLYFPSLLGYFDACEYDSTHVLYNDSHLLEGPLVCDFDYTYDFSTYPKLSGDASLSAMIATYTENNNNITTTSITHSTTSSKTRKAQPPLLSHISTTNTNHTYDNTKAWPSSLEFFQIGDRVDCLDYKGTWYSGSVMDLLDLNEKDIKQYQLMRYSRDFMQQPNYGTNNTTNVSSKVLCSPGLHMRVHFDGFKGNWDEWYDQRDFQCGFIVPVFTHASRKLKMHEIPVIQRRLVYTSSSTPNHNEDQPPVPPGYTSTDNSPVNTNTSVSLHIDILDSPSFIQGESYRSCLHLHNHIHEQMLRYVDNELLLHTLQLPVGHPDQPFSIRLLSFDNLLAAPIDCYCPITTVVARDQKEDGYKNDNSGAEHGVQKNGTTAVVTSNVSPGLQFTIADRFNGHKLWEGSGFPMDVCRPIGNIYHSKLAIAVDWIVFVDNTQSNGNNNMGGVGEGNGIFNSNRAMTPKSSGIAAGLLHDSMVFRHEHSYTHYLAQLKENQMIMQQNEVRKREQQAREDRMKSKSVVNSNETSGSIAAIGPMHKPVDKLLEAYHNDQRNGLTIEEVLSKFVHSEDIEEYYCNTCKKQTPGKLHSSIHTLPDVLILHLQRLVMNGNGGGKIRTLVKFPLSQLNMKPFTTEQKELISNLAENGANFINGSDGASNNDDADHKDVYELYGVVNHLGGMNGGHYTALSKVEEIVLHDVLKQRYSSTNNVNGSGLASSSAVNNGGAKKEGVYYDDVNISFPDTKTSGTKLSLSEFIATSIPSGTNPTNADINSNKTTAVSRWLKFDDEFVNVVPGANLHTNVVTESAVLLFYQRKNMSPKNLIQYV